MVNPAMPASNIFQPQAPGKAETLPALYARWIEAIIHGPLPDEIEATCNDCVMCSRPGESGETEQFFFDKGSKCCTYTPTLSNFMVGAILGDSAPSMTTGRATLAARLGKGLGVDPLAIHPPPAYSLLYRHSRNAFGRNSTLRCPHLDTARGACTIRPYRDPTCVTWFCKHHRGKIGQSFWQALQIFLNAAIKELSLWCVLQLNIGDEALALLESKREGGMTGENLQSNELDGRCDAKSAGKTWGRWWQQETAFYSECARLVSDLDFREVERICGPEVQVSSRLVRQAYAKLQETHVPPHLRIGRFEVEDATFDVVRVWSYSRLDPLDLPVPVYMALSYFDGRPTNDALSMVEHDLGTHIDSSLLRTLIDFGILETGQEPG
jgi:hypothetical protein